MLTTYERHEIFLGMLPQIQEQANFAFRHHRREAREELIAETVATCWVSFVRLVERGKMEAVAPTPLVQYAIRHVRVGRRVGTPNNGDDVSSEYAQRRRGFELERLPIHRQARKGVWRELLIESRKAGPADTAASRLDFAAWLRSLPKRLRQIADTLAAGETTNTVARKFALSAGRVSQLRRELEQRWRDFQGDATFG